MRKQFVIVDASSGVRTGPVYNSIQEAANDCNPGQGIRHHDPMMPNPRDNASLRLTEAEVNEALKVVLVRGRRK